MLNKPFITTAQMAALFLVLLVLPSSTIAKPASPVNDEEKKEDSSDSSKTVVDFTVHIGEAGQEYNEKIKVDQDKQTELFEVPAHPGVDRSDTLHDFKNSLTMLRFPDSKVCYLFPLAKEQSAPEKLIKDLETAKQNDVTETRRVDTTWIIDGELTDRSVLSDELAQFCAQYPIYHVREARETLKVTGIQTKERPNRKRRQSGMNNLCLGGWDLDTAYEHCSKPYLKCKVTDRTCYKYVICSVGFGPGEQPPPYLRAHRVTVNSNGDICWKDHIYRAIVCCEYICK